MLQTDEQLSKHEACGAALAYVTTGTFMQILCNYPEDRETVSLHAYTTNRLWTFRFRRLTEALADPAGRKSDFPGTRIAQLKNESGEKGKLGKI